MAGLPYLAKSREVIDCKKDEHKLEWRICSEGKVMAENEDLALPESMRDELKKPFGTVIKTSELSEYMQRAQPKTIITVGDMVSAVLHENGYDIKLAIIDEYTKRKKAEDLSARNISIGEKIVKVKNPAARITRSLINEVINALKAKERTKIVVEGEEDLAALPCILYAEEGSLVVYGMPNEGMVMVKIDKKIKEKVRKIMRKMQRRNENGDRHNLKERESAA
jgi:uncharacterized protein (UPF0218 family)